MIYTTKWYLRNKIRAGETHQNKAYRSIMTMLSWYTLWNVFSQFFFYISSEVRRYSKYENWHNNSKSRWAVGSRALCCLQCNRTGASMFRWRPPHTQWLAAQVRSRGDTWHDTQGDKEHDTKWCGGTWLYLLTYQILLLWLTKQHKPIKRNPC